MQTDTRRSFKKIVTIIKGILIYIKHYTMYNKFFLYKKRTKDRDIQTEDLAKINGLLPSPPRASKIVIGEKDFEETQTNLRV